MLKGNLGLDRCNQCVRLVQCLLQMMLRCAPLPLTKHVKGRSTLYASTRILEAVRPMLGTVPNIRAIPCKVTWHTTLETFDRLASHHVESTTDRYCDDDVFYLFLQKQKIEAELHIYLEEGTYHKRLFRGPNTNDMKK
jgi:hypothetical protein